MKTKTLSEYFQEFDSRKVETVDGVRVAYTLAEMRELASHLRLPWPQYGEWMKSPAFLGIPIIRVMPE